MSVIVIVAVMAVVITLAVIGGGLDTFANNVKDGGQTIAEHDLVQSTIQTGSNIVSGAVNSTVQLREAELNS